MGLVEEFITRYRKEFDFYEQAGRLVAQTLDVSLQSAGIRSMVTFRAKSLSRLEEKIRQRAERTTYASIDDIFNDIVDLAGVRVALYFPGERKPVDNLIKDLFTLIDVPKEFPTESTPSYDKRFSGYWATHYRVRLRDISLTDSQKRYADARVEIQVASVLMHAWAEVEHDLVYKPLQGSLSLDEYAILDELNGLVIAGEIALERLQRAGETRVAATGRRFSNHYDLAAYLVDRAQTLLKGPLVDTALGRVDLLFDLIKELNMVTPEQLSPYIDALDADIERRPIAEQIVDQILVEDQSRYGVYENLRKLKQLPSALSTLEVALPDYGTQREISEFLMEWIDLERRVRALAQEPSNRPAAMLTARQLKHLGLLDPHMTSEFERIRRLRNHVVHGIQFNPEDISDAIAFLREVKLRLPAEAQPGT